jgi:hypothetical protein
MKSVSWQHSRYWEMLCQCSQNWRDSFTLGGKMAFFNGFKCWNLRRWFDEQADSYFSDNRPLSSRGKLFLESVFSNLTSRLDPALDLETGLSDFHNTLLIYWTIWSNGTNHIWMTFFSSFSRWHFKGIPVKYSESSSADDQILKAIGLARIYL